VQGSRLSPDGYRGPFDIHPTGPNARWKTEPAPVFESSKGLVRNDAHRNFAPMTTPETHGGDVQPLILQADLPIESWPPLILQTDLPIESWLPPAGLPASGFRVRNATSPMAMLMMGRLLGFFPTGFVSGQLQKRHVTAPVIQWWMNGFDIASYRGDFANIFVRTLRATRRGAGLRGLGQKRLRLVHAQRFGLALELSSLLRNDPDGMTYANVLADVFGLWRVRDESEVTGLCLKIVVPYPFLNFHFKHCNASAVEVDRFVLAAMRGVDVPAHSFLSAPHMHTDLAVQGMAAHCREEWRIEI
jgi:hypothetical protein